VKRDEPRRSGNRGTTRRPQDAQGQGRRERNYQGESTRSGREEALWRQGQDGGPSRGERGRSKRRPDGGDGWRQSASVSGWPDDDNDALLPFTHWDDEAPPRRSRSARPGSARSQRDRRVDEEYLPRERTRPPTGDSRAKGIERERTRSLGERDASARGGDARSYGGRGRSGDRDVYPDTFPEGETDDFGDRMFPERPFDDDGRSSPRSRRGLGTALAQYTAERWGVRVPSDLRSVPAKGIKGLWRRYGTTGPRRAAIITLLVAMAVCSLSSLVTGVVAASTGISAYSHANDGLTHLRTGERLLQSLSGSGFSVDNIQQARSEFAAAAQDFAQVNDSLGGIPGFAESAPFAGSKLQTITNLASVADNFSQIGVSGCDALVILVGALSHPFGSSESTGSKSAPPTVGLTPDNLTTIQAKLKTINALLDDSTAQINALQPSDLSFDAKLGSQLAKLKAELPAIQQGLQEAQAFMGVAGTVLGVGTPSNYLVELLDSTELRPGGGFIGNIGTLTLKGGTLGGLHVQDVDLLDRPFEFNGGFIPFPSQYQWFPQAIGVSNWSVRDSNLDGDFPTDAANAEKNYQLEGGQTQVQGVIAITPWLIEKAIAITGSISVPEFKETVTSSNMVSLIHYYQLGPGHGSDYVPDPGSLSSKRKAFTAYLFKHFMERVKSIIGSKRGAFIKLGLSALATKDVQIYFNNSVAEQILRHHSLASAIEAPDSGDSLLVVDANVVANKANNFITYTMADKVTIDQNGVATHTLSLSYKWPTSTAATDANNYGSKGGKTFYHDYVRVYVPPQATLISQAGWDYRGQSKAFGRLVFAGYIGIWYGGSQNITLSWKVPNAAVKSGDSWTYQELVQHQAGNVWSASMQLALAKCGHVTSVTAPWTMGSDAMSASIKGSLTEDKSYVTTYTCAPS
jgi:uncharacterized protein DUF4012